MLPTSPPELRHWVYAAAGAIPDDPAHALLLRALAADPEMVDVVATALSEHHRERDIPAIYEALHRCAPWQRTDLEEAIRDIRDRTLEDDLPKDWRLRYRFDPILSGFPLRWPVIASIARREDVRNARRPADVHTLEQILAFKHRKTPQPKCECCGVPYWQSIGVPVCPATAVDIAVLQSAILAKLQERVQSDHLFDLLDALDVELMDLVAKDAEREGRGRKPARGRSDNRIRIDFLRSACLWAVERGHRDVDSARAAMLAEAQRLAGLHGDPRGLLEPPREPARATAAPGRNDPCPCGSGRKYKKCCALQVV